MLSHEAHTLAGGVSVFSTLAASLASAIDERAADGELTECAEMVDRLEAICSDVAAQTLTLTIDGLLS